MTVAKSRADLLTDERLERVAEVAYEIAEDFEADIKNMDGGTDHVHVLFSTKPTTTLTKFINSLKGVTSRRIRQEYPEVKDRLEDAFWQPGYFLATTGQVSINVSMDYVKTSSMTATTTKTLEATLAPPTAHKERKLCDLLDTYRLGLQEAFEAGGETMTATTDVVTPYDLPYQAKAALCNYVPQLNDTYDAQELDDEHPVRLTNQAAEFDHSPERDYEFTWWAPQPGRGTNFWIPLRINPAQEGLWYNLVDGEPSAGQLRLQRHRQSWSLHVTVEFSVEEPDDRPTDEDVTPVSFDIGEAHLFAGCACEQDTPTDPLLIDGGRARQLRKEMFTTLKRLQERDAAEWRIDERFDHYQNVLTDIIEKASRRAVEYARRFEKPVVVLEDLSDIRENLDYGEWMNRRLHAWAFAHLQQRIEDKAREAGLPVRCVRPAYTSQTCHEC